MHLLRSEIRVFYYRSRRRPGAVNFGDSISPLLVEHLTGRRTVWSEVEGADLVAIGSVLQRVQERRWRRPLWGRLDPIAVWGTGFVRDGGLVSLRMLDVLALRGPRTAGRLPDVKDAVFGDPGILFGEVFRPLPDRRCGWGVIPHVSDSEAPELARIADTTSNSRVIQLTGDPLETLAAIAGCDHIVSSSLHGLVAADALGIPNWRISLGGRIVGGDFKFEDYAEGIGRPSISAQELPSRGNLDVALPRLPTDFGYQKDIPSRAQRLASALTQKFG